MIESNKDKNSLYSILPLEVFQRHEIDFMESINPLASLTRN